MRMLALMALGLVVTGCSRAAPTDANAAGADVPIENIVVPASEGGDEATPTSTPTPTPGVNEQAYLGRWIGVEGMYLMVTPQTAGKVGMTMQWDLDHKGTFTGTVTPAGLRFTRNGVVETAARTDGDATGLKYLAGKKVCLTVKPGEGYCRQ